MLSRKQIANKSIGIVLSITALSLATSVAVIKSQLFIWYFQEK